MIVFIIIFLQIQQYSCQVIDCVMPNDINASRQTRLHHPCESNRNVNFGIETHDEFYCIYYSSIETSLFGESNVEMKIDGGWDVEQTGALNFEFNSTALSFTILNDDVIIKVTQSSHEMPTISSVIVTEGLMVEQYCELECGVRSEAVPVIINGKHVREGAWPWHAAIYLRRTSDSIDFRCGSTIINKRTLITIATCLVTYNPKVQKRVEISATQLIVGVGETVLFDASGARQNHHVERIKFHENFLKDGRMSNGLKDDYNLALLVLKDDIVYSLHVRPICLPESDEYDYDDKVGKVVGWGFSEEGDLKISTHLQDLTVPTYKFLTCLFRTFNRTWFAGFSARRNFCAGFQAKRGICTADSGGGLYIEENSKFVIYGLASHANCECIEQENKCRIFGEGIFVNIIEFLQWIYNNMY